MVHAPVHESIYSPSHILTQLILGVFVRLLYCITYNQKLSYQNIETKCLYDLKDSIMANLTTLKTFKKGNIHAQVKLMEALQKSNYSMILHTALS